MFALMVGRFMPRICRMIVYQSFYALNEGVTDGVRETIGTGYPQASLAQQPGLLQHAR